MEKATAGAIAFVVVEVLWLPVKCPIPKTSACENPFGWTMFGTVGFTDKVGTTVAAFLLGLAIYGIASRFS